MLATTYKYKCTGVSLQLLVADLEILGPWYPTSHMANLSGYTQSEPARSAGPCENPHICVDLKSSARASCSKLRDLIAQARESHLRPCTLSRWRLRLRGFASAPSSSCPGATPTNPAPRREAEGRPKALVDTFWLNRFTSILNAICRARCSRILCHHLGTRLLLAGCLLLGAGFLIKLDATGPCGKILECNAGVLAAFERRGSGAKLDSIARGYVAANMLAKPAAPAARASDTKMQYGYGYGYGDRSRLQLLFKC